MAADTGIADDGTTQLNLPSTAQQSTLSPTDHGDGTYTWDEILRRLVGFQRSHKAAHATGGRDAITPASIGAVPGTLDTDVALAANSDTRVPSQKAVKAYADALIAANDAMVFKGVINCSANPNYPAADRGDTYRVSVAGKIGGASGTNVEVGDVLICLTDATASGTQAAVGAQWEIVQTNIDGAVVGPASSVADNLASFNGATGKLIKDSGLSIDTDGTLAANSDSRLATQKAVKTFAQPLDADLTAIAALAGQTAYGRAFLTLADRAAVLALLLVPDTYALESGKWYANPRGATTTLVLTDQRVCWIPIDLLRATTFDRIGFEVVTTPGGSGSVVRAGFYSDGGNKPGALLSDSGTVAATSTGFKEITVSQLLPAGRSWLALCGQGAPTPSPTVRAIASTASDPTIGMATQSVGWAGFHLQASVSGGLPNPAVPSGQTSGPPLIHLRVA